MTVMYWLGAAAIFVVIEIITMGLTTIWFAGGALVGAVMAAFPCHYGVRLSHL